ncbi:SDR family NAD(P)-dependent oxidoreductase [Roseomonas sp. AR75]|uniref:SDR family NAD(P)-dependent oxidoreductase n=1 Tax=Roseomonas sp. AR75 TaxID=2562311 RepID=UPI0010C0353D|nr:SDR family NAD(P)-dependent oxidoreductase [Roseomonas sp. AR75]
MRVTSRFDAEATARDVVAGLDLRGRTALVTGAAGAMGQEIAAALSGAGARVVMADVEEAKLRDAAGTLAAEAVPLDLSALGAIRRFAAAWRGPLHMLVNNAGVMACPERRTAEGHELQFGVNYLGHWMLATQLAPALEQAAQESGEPARIVSVSSIAHRRSDILWEDLDYRRRPYDRWEAYGQSKTACALLAIAATERLGARGIACNALNPGGAMTGLMRHLSTEEMRANGWLDENGRPPARWRSAAQCAATATWAATAPDLLGIGGLYLEECQEAAPAHPDRPMQGVLPHARDPASAHRLWELSEAMTA